MNNMWQTLGLAEPTSDIRAIKKAYAKKLKIIRPDEDPEGFMALRQAFEQAKRAAPYLPEAAVKKEASGPVTLTNDALSWLDNFESNPSEPENADSGRGNFDGENEIESDQFSELPNTDIFEIESENWPPEEFERFGKLKIQTIENSHLDLRPVERVKGEDERLMDQVKALSDQNRQNFIPAWDEVLDQKFDLSIDEYQQFEFELKHYLIAQFQDAEIEEYGQIDYQNTNPLNKPPLGSNVINHIIAHMEWETSDSLYSHHGLDELTRLKFKAGVKKERSPNYPVESSSGRASSQDDNSGFPFWMIIFLAVIGMNIVRVITSQNDYKSPIYDQARYEEIQKIIDARTASPLYDLSNSSERSFAEVSFDEYFDLLKQGTTVAERVNQRRFETYLMNPETDISFLVSAKNDKTLSVEKQVILESALSRMRARWSLEQKFRPQTGSLGAQKDLSPQMKALLGIKPTTPSQTLEDSMKMLEGLTLDPSKVPTQE